MSVRAEPRTLDARAIWTRADLVYVASPDSGVLLPGMSLSIRRGPLELARGHVERLYEPRLALVRVNSGSLGSENRLDDLRIEGEPAIPLGPTALRVGLPARERRNLLFACDAPGVQSTFANEHFRIDTLRSGGLRMRRLIESPCIPATPDTIDITFFAEATDAEIALERGDLDVAVFWPGELSARMRGGEHAPHVFAGRRSRGLLVCVSAAPDSQPVPPADLALLNRDGFAGDLAAWDSAPVNPGAWTTARYRVSPALPGARVLERVLARVNRATATRSVELRYLDEPIVRAPHAVAAEGAATASPAGGRMWLERGIQPAFAMQCLVVSTARAHAIVSTLGPDTFADLIVCGGAPR